jgi:Ribbon-helix-helix protein, copG family
MANRNPTGWTSPANLALRLVSFRLPQDTVDELTAAAAATGLPKRKVIQQAIADFAAKHRHESSDVLTPRLPPKSISKSRLRGRG